MNSFVAAGSRRRDNDGSTRDARAPRFDWIVLVQRRYCLPFDLR